MSEQEVFDVVEKVRDELFELLSKAKPELLPLYIQRAEYALSPYYPLSMRVYNAYLILRAYVALKEHGILREAI